MITAEFFIEDGVELPVWFFETWVEFEQFNDMLDEDWMSHVRVDRFPLVSGFIYNNWPFTTENRVAAFAVAENWFEDAARRET